VRKILLAFLLSLITTEAAEARRGIVVPIPVRIVAYIGESLEGVRPEFTWTVSYGRRDYQLYILKLTVLNGRATPLDIDAAVAPYQHRFQLAGDKKALENFAAVPPRQQVVIRGYVRLQSGARFLMLDAVEPGVVPTPQPTR